MSLEDISRSAARLSIEADAASTTSDDSVETVVPAGPRRTKSATSLQATATDGSLTRAEDVGRHRVQEEEVAPRADRGVDVTRANAQGVCPPDACLFAANLLVGQTELQLEHALHSILDGFGRNWIQIKEDRNRYPFAIIQFETVEVANAALRDAQGMMCAGRPVRLEKAKVDRALLITRTEGDRVVTEHEARDLLTRFGQIETICSTDLIPGRNPELPRGQYVRFMYWLDCRDALGHFRDQHSQGFRLRISNGLEPRQVEYGHTGATIVTGLAQAHGSVDSTSIYVGNLPRDAEMPEVKDIFSRFGEVVVCNVVKKDYPYSYNCFSFVEFATKEDAQSACNSVITLRQHRLRIEPKEYTTRRAHRTALGEAIRNPPSVPQPSYATSSRPRQFAHTTPQQRVEPGARVALQGLVEQNNKDNNALAGRRGPEGTGVYLHPHRRRGRGVFGNSRY